MTDFLKHVRRYLLGEGPDRIDERARVAKDLIEEEARGLKADVQKLLAKDDPLDALMTNVQAVRNQAELLKPTRH